jgi:hypothetical protein
LKIKLSFFFFLFFVFFLFFHLKLDPHFSHPTGGTHNAFIGLKTGMPANPGLVSLAETGNPVALRHDLIEGRKHGYVYGIVAIEHSVLAHETAHTEFSIHRDFHFVSLSAKINPSPDWIAAVDSVSLIDEDGWWVKEKTVDLYPYDVGTADGTTYLSPAVPTDPVGVIRSLRGEGVFGDEPIATLHFERVDDDHCNGVPYEDFYANRILSTRIGIKVEDNDRPGCK